MRTPWHIWVVGLVALIWSAGGALDYVMTQTRNEGYLAGFNEAQLAFFHSFPTWSVATWALSVWLGVVGALLLLLRSRFSAWAFGMSLLATLATSVQSFVLSEVSMVTIMGPEAAAFSAAIVVIALMLWRYAKRMTRAGVLR